MATNVAIESKWCNWELGYGDTKKYDSNSIAIFPIKPTNDNFKGTEYIDLYPHITYYRGYEQYTNGDSILKDIMSKQKNGYIHRKGRKIWQDECFLVFTMIMILTDLWLLEIVG